MNRRNSRALRVENFLYDYNVKSGKWLPKNRFVSEDLFKNGVFYTCKRMSQKTNPVGFRLGNTRFWDFSWVAPKNLYSKFLQEDLAIRKYLANVFAHIGFGTSKILIKRAHGKFFVKIYIKKFKFISSQNIFTSETRGRKLYGGPLKKLNYLGLKLSNKILVNKAYNPLFFKKEEYTQEFNGTFKDITLQDISFNKNTLKQIPNKNFIRNNLFFCLFKKRFSNKLFSSTTLNNKEDTPFLYKQPLKFFIKNTLEKFTGTPVYCSIVEDTFSLSSASSFCDAILNELRFSRNSFRNILTSLFKEISSLKNIKGIRINCSGRLSKTTTMAQTEWFRIGQIPLTTISANIDYAYGTAKTKNGLCGVKVWIYYK